MKVVDAVEVHVLRMPSKRGLPHAKVEVGSVDTLNNDATLLLYHIQQGVEMTDIPLFNTLDNWNSCYSYELRKVFHIAPNLHVCDFLNMATRRRRYVK